MSESLIRPPSIPSAPTQPSTKFNFEFINLSQIYFYNLFHIHMLSIHITTYYYTCYYRIDMNKKYKGKNFIHRKTQVSIR